MKFKVGQQFLVYYNKLNAKVVAVCQRGSAHYCLAEIECKGFKKNELTEAWYREEGEWVISGSLRNLDSNKEYIWIYSDTLITNPMLMETE